MTVLIKNRYEVIVLRDLIDQYATDWESLGSLSKIGSIYSSVRYCKVTGLADGVTQTFFLAYENGIIQGGLMADLMPTDVAPHYQIQQILEGNHIVSGIEPWKCPVDLMPCMLSTSRAGRSTDVRIRADATHEEQKAIFTSLVSAMEEVGMEGGAKTTGLISIPSDAIAVQEVLLEKGYTKAQIGAHNYLTMTGFKSIQDYFNTLKSKRRRSAMNEYLVHEDPDVRFERKPLIQGLDDHIRFNVFNFAKYSSRFNPESYRKRLKYFAEVFGEDAYVLEMYYRGELLGSAQMLRYKNILAGRTVGILPDAPKKFAVYFNLVFYQSILMGIELGIDYLTFGPDLYETKASRGFDFEYQDLYLKTDHPKVIERMGEIDRYMQGQMQQWEEKRQRNRHLTTP